MSQKIPPDCFAQLQRAVNAAKATVTGWQRVQHAQHAIFLQTALAAFGDSPHATFYIEGLAPNANIPRPDLILLHPDVGVLVIENKGITLEQIQSIDNTSIHLVRDGRLKHEDPFAQAETVMYALKDLAALRIDLREALFLRTAVFPRIRRSELESRFDCTFPNEALFSDACHDPHEFRLQVLAYSNAALRQQKKKCRLSLHAHDILTHVILSGKSVFTPSRRIRLASPDPTLLGAHVQELELALKEATQEQRDHGRADLRGAHRLFRGVAGSGKSVMLALSTAQTLLLHRQEQPTLFQNPSPKRILVTCYNRALVPYLRAKITERFARIAWDKPSEHELVVVHFEGLLKLLQTQQPRLSTKLSYDQKAERAQFLCQRFDALPEPSRRALQFDAVYVDEAQDLQPAEFEFLRRLALSDDGAQSLLLFYDNAQNIYGVPPPTWSDLGINIIGRTQFLDQCLRNTRELLAFAFNILVGSYAPEGTKVSTRKFADVASLRQRGLIEENAGAFDIRFASRAGPHPRIAILPSRAEEIHAVTTEIQRLFRDEQVLPSDILILYNSHHPYKKDLAQQLERLLPKGYSLRHVDSDHNENKNLPLIDDTVLTLSTIASAKGYDAPVVFLLGVDVLSTTDQDRARFYVAATRAKLLLYVYATHTDQPSLLPEIIHASKRILPVIQTLPIRPPSPVDDPSRFQDLAIPPRPTPPVFHCQHCGSQTLHCQQGRAGYHFLCIDCTQITPLPRKCSRCGQTARIRAKNRNFIRTCTQCTFTETVYTNLPLDSF
jgi:superfamily I DNA and RNA helicase